MEILSYENESMKSSINKQMNELQMYQKGSLTQDQTASLLQEVKILEEKLDNAQKGKEFFREQWSKAVRELHRMKVDYQEAMQVQIKNSREELMSTEYVTAQFLTNLRIPPQFQSTNGKILDKLVVEKKYRISSFFAFIKYNLIH